MRVFNYDSSRFFDSKQGLRHRLRPGDTFYFARHGNMASLYVIISVNDDGIDNVSGWAFSKVWFLHPINGLSTTTLWHDGIVFEH